MITIHDEPGPAPGKTLLETSIPSDLSLKTALALRLVSTLAEHGLVDASERSKLEVCFEEGLNNAIVHGNECRPESRVWVRLFRDATSWGVTIEDEGSGFTFDDIPDAESDDYPWAESGRGIAIMEHVSDGLVYFDHGRRLLLWRHVRAQDGSPPGVPVGATPATEFLERDGVLIARLSLPSAEDSAVAARLAEVLEVAEERGLAALEVDLALVPSLSSFALGRLVALAKTCLRLERELSLANPSEELRGLFAAMRLEATFGLPESSAEPVEVTAGASSTVDGCGSGSRPERV